MKPSSVTVECEHPFPPTPPGYRIERTTDKVSSLGKRFFRRWAIKLARQHRPQVSSYRLVVEPAERGRGWEVNVYQNVAVPENEVEAA